MNSYNKNISPLWSIATALIIAMGPAPGSAAPILYAIDNLSPTLSVVDAETGIEKLTIPLVFDGMTFNRANGLAVHPITNEMYAAIKFAEQAGSGRNLIKIDPQTGETIDLGNMQQPIASLAFDSSGTLYAVSGDCSSGCGGAAIAETLFTVNLDNANLTQVRALGNGNDGEAIAYNPVDGMMYHMSGWGQDLIFEKVHLSTGTITDIPLSGEAIGNYEAIGFTYDLQQGVFVGSLIDCLCGAEDRAFFKLTADGVLSYANTLPRWWKDFAFYDTAGQDTDGDGVPDDLDAYPLGQFDDAPPGSFAFSFIEALARAGITGGCGGNNYCPDNSVTRAQMAVFLERGMHGSNFVPPAASGNVFLDVAANAFAAAFIEQLFLDGITAGCAGNNYCPNVSVNRAQMAVFLLRAKHGAAYIPPPPSGVFDDVDVSYWAVSWIEQLAAEEITSGCGGGNYCPEDPVTRAQMAVFLVRTFGL